MSDPLDTIDSDTRDLLEEGRAEWDNAYDEYLSQWGAEILARAGENTESQEDQALK